MTSIATRARQAAALARMENERRMLHAAYRAARAMRERGATIRVATSQTMARAAVRDKLGEMHITLPPKRMSAWLREYVARLPEPPDIRVRGDRRQAERIARNARGMTHMRWMRAG